MKLKYIKILLLLGIVMVVFLSPLKNYLNIEKLTLYIKELRDKPFAELIYVLIYIVGVIFALPGFVLTIIAGSIFGFWKALLLVTLAANVGCHLTFLISRFLGKDFFERFIKSKGYIDRMSDNIEKKGFKVMLYLRIMPIVPFNIVNYVSGLTKIKYRDYTLGTFVGMFPATIVYIILSYTVFDTKNNQIGIIASISAIIVFTILIYLLKRRNNK
ncbi:MAG: TVP38/TMEM64 family protein [Clostridiales bacterium]